MNLDNLKQDIRHSVGDIKGDKFTPARLLLAIRKTINKLNYQFHLNKTTSYIPVIAYKKVYSLPKDFYFLNSCLYNGEAVKSIHSSDKVINESSESANMVNYIVYDKDQFNSIGVQPIPTDISVTYHIVDPTGNQLTIDIDNATAIKYKDGAIYLLYGVTYCDFTSNITASIESTDGLLEVNHVSEYDLYLTSSLIDIPYSFYDAIHYKVVADLLADDNRAEVMSKALKYESDYNLELKKRLQDDMSSYVAADLLTNYEVGV